MDYKAKLESIIEQANKDILFAQAKIQVATEMLNEIEQTEVETETETVLTTI